MVVVLVVVVVMVVMVGVVLVDVVVAAMLVAVVAIVVVVMKVVVVVFFPYMMPFVFLFFQKKMSSIFGHLCQTSVRLSGTTFAFANDLCFFISVNV